MRLIDVSRELRRRNEILYWLGWINIASLLFAVVMLAKDDTIITGINAWVKPAKFALSITIYAWTFGWMLYYLNDPPKTRLISWTIFISMMAENILIFMQAFRGTTSHFNITTLFNAIVFQIMAGFILLNTIAVVYTLILFFKRPTTLNKPMLIAWRWGITLFAMGTISGGIMAALLRHTIGGEDGGPSLPYINWSTVAGDIRAAHFFTLHGLQVIPLMSYVLLRTFSKGKIFIVAFAVAYTVFCIWLHYQALSGLPLIRL